MSSTPSTDELLALGAPIALRDGSRVRVNSGEISSALCMSRPKMFSIQS
jgi:hypothetical protein